MGVGWSMYAGRDDGYSVLCALGRIKHQRYTHASTGAGEAPRQPAQVALHAHRRRYQPRAAAVRTCARLDRCAVRERRTLRHHPHVTYPKNRPKRLHFPFSLLAPCRDPALAPLHLNQLRPAWVLQHSPYTVRAYTDTDGTPSLGADPDGPHRCTVASYTDLDPLTHHTPKRWSATRTNSPSAARPAATVPPPPCSAARSWP